MPDACNPRAEAGSNKADNNKADNDEADDNDMSDKCDVCKWMNAVYDTI
jgi:hypothetical protein